MENEKRYIEAALFISSRPVSLDDLKKLTGIGAMGYIQKMLIELKQEYESRGSAVEINEVEGKYEMRVGSAYVERVKEFAQDAEISKAALRTLAFISKHDGMLKSELVKKIGPQIYDDVHELVETGFVKQKKAGRSSQLMLTEKFKRYFTRAEATAPAAPAEQSEQQQL
ncbi:MAG: SMC-Scp complex subunit ScpB [Candidatus Micrarchaeota archaeon]